MQIQNLSSNIAFKKQLQAKCSVMNKDNELVPCSIYKLEPGKDKNYFSEIKNKDDWKNSDNFSTISMLNNFLKKKSPFSIYTMESKNGHCIGFAEACDFDEDIEISIMETAPALSSFNKKSKNPLKYIGENFIAFFVNMATKQMKMNLNIEADNSAIPYFTQKCNFKNYLNNPTFEDETTKLTLPRYEFNSFLDKNKEHTKTGVVLIS